MTGFGHFPWQTHAKQTGSNQQSFNFDHPLSFSHSLSELNLRSAYKVAESVAPGITGRSDFLNLPMVTNLDVYAVVPHNVIVFPPVFVFSAIESTPSFWVLPGHICLHIHCSPWCEHQYCQC